MVYKKYRLVFVFPIFIKVKKTLMNKKNLSPIVLFVYNRLKHLKKTIEALQFNKLAKSSNLIVYSDGPKNNKDIGVLEVRKYQPQLHLRYL